ncbi:hypothetical protein CEXT_384311 [Caerostris extrusa]|uniref:Uncharacterized protein n=1 Tax=Caerostris extrusa TaxID=172846 RepID=A0AAV4WRE6_CAEEX|nr:hypothetical protein CEXT_384311 [Caerostris extrusa]
MGLMAEWLALWGSVPQVSDSPPSGVMDVCSETDCRRTLSTRTRRIKKQQPPPKTKTPYKSNFQSHSLFAHFCTKASPAKLKTTGRRSPNKPWDCYPGTTSTQTTGERRRDSGTAEKWRMIRRNPADISISAAAGGN